MNKSKMLNLVKVMTMFLVVLAHTTRMYTPYAAITNIENIKSLKIITDFIYSFHMPFFFFISGFVYSICISNGKYKDTKLFIKNKFLRLIIPYLIFGIFYVTPILMYLKIFKKSFLYNVFINIVLLRDSRHLWFLPILFSIFLIMTLLKKYINKKWIYIILITFILNIIFSTFYVYYFSNIFTYLFYFCIGIYFDKNYDKIKNKNILIYILLFLIHIILFKLKKLSVLYGMLGCYWFFGFNLFLSRFIKEGKINRMLVKYNMGIYLFHPMIIYLYFSSKFIEFSNWLINCIISICLAYVGSLILTKILYLLKFEYIVGEKRCVK